MQRLDHVSSRTAPHMALRSPLSLVARLLSWDPTRFGIALFSAALFLRLLAVALVDWKGDVLDEGFDSGTSWEFFYMARGLFTSGDFTFRELDGREVPSAFQPPLYPLFVALVLWMRGIPVPAMATDAGALIALQVVNCLAGALWCLVLWRLAARLSEGAGRLAALLGCLYPPLLYSATEIHSHNFVLLALVGFLYFACRYTTPGSPSMRVACGLGLTAGLLMLLRAEASLLCMAVLAGLALTQQSSSARRQLLLAGGLALALLAPWIGRNYRSLGGHVVHTTTMGYNLYRGQGPEATGTGYGPDGREIAVPPALKAELRAMPWSRDYEVRRDQRLRRAALEHVRTHPTQPLELVPRKLGAFLIGDFSHPNGRNPGVWVSGLLLLAAAVLGMLRSRGRGVEVWPVYAALGFYLLIVCVFFVLPRYRLTIDPLLMVFAGFWLAGLLPRKGELR